MTETRSPVERPGFLFGVHERQELQRSRDPRSYNLLGEEALYLFSTISGISRVCASGEGQQRPQQKNQARH